MYPSLNNIPKQQLKKTSKNIQDHLRSCGPPIPSSALGEGVVAEGRAIGGEAVANRGVVHTASAGARPGAHS